MPLPSAPPQNPASPFASMRWHHTGIRYPDFEQALAFWVDTMGAGASCRSGPTATSPSPTSCRPPRTTSASRSSAVPAPPAQPRFGDVDATLAEIVNPPFEIDDISARLAFFRDPWGTMFELSERLGDDHAP
jgi:glyoxylase I family protein